MVHPTPNRLIGHRHSAFRQQIFDVAQAEGEPKIEPYSLVNDLRWETIPAVADFLHPLGYSATGRTASPTRRDNAPPRYLSANSCCIMRAQSLAKSSNTPEKSINKILGLFTGCSFVGIADSPADQCLYAC